MDNSKNNVDKTIEQLDNEDIEFDNSVRLILAIGIVCLFIAELVILAHIL
jgi:hypothetical protein